MPVAAVRKLSKPQNGVGAFILQCTKMEMLYCNGWGSSVGMNAFLKHDLARFARQNPSIEIVVAPQRQSHPLLRGHYVNGTSKTICVRNLEPSEIFEKAELLRNTSGERLRRVNKPVASLKEGVRGIWDPFHGGGVAVRDLFSRPKG